DAEEAAVEQAHGARQHVLAAHVVALHLLLDVRAQVGQRAGEHDHVLELRLVAASAPARVVEVLLAALVVDPRRLDVAAGIRADPDLLPGRRDDELVDAPEDLRVVDTRAIGVEVDEPAAVAAPPQARARAVGTAQARDGAG